MSSNRWLIAAGLGLLLLVIASVAVGTRGVGDTEFPPDSPERAVQQYVRAVQNEDADALIALLSPDFQRRCELSDIRSIVRSPGERDLRVTLRDAKTTSDTRAVVRVRVTESSGAGLFDSGTYDHEETFDLARIGGTWLVDQPTWPVYCRPMLAPPVPPTATPTPPASTATPGASPASTPSN